MASEGKGEAGTRKAAPAASAATSVSGVAARISIAAEAAIAEQNWDAATGLHALDQRLQEVLTALPAASASVDEASDVGIALKALSALLT